MGYSFVEVQPTILLLFTWSIIIKVAISGWTLDQGGMGSQVFHLTNLWRDLRLSNEGVFLRGRLGLGDLGHTKNVWMLPTLKK